MFDEYYKQIDKLMNKYKINAFYQNKILNMLK